MPKSFEITGLTGNTPLTIYVCDGAGDDCVLIAYINSSIPPSLKITLPTMFDKAPAILLRIIDGNNCQKFKKIVCNNIIP